MTPPGDPRLEAIRTALQLLVEFRRALVVLDFDLDGFPELRAIENTLLRERLRRLAQQERPTS